MGWTRTESEGGASSSAAQCRSSEKMIGATCRMQERVFDNALPISAAYVIAGWNRSIIRAHWSGPRLFLSASGVSSLRHLGSWNRHYVFRLKIRDVSEGIDIRWIELIEFAYDSLFLPRDEGKFERKMDGRTGTILSSVYRFSAAGHFNLISFSNKKGLQSFEIFLPDDIHVAVKCVNIFVEYTFHIVVSKGKREKLVYRKMSFKSLFIVFLWTVEMEAKQRSVSILS